MIKIGADIHSYIVKDKKIIAKDLYEGRNSEWFNNLQQGEDIEYDHFQWYKQFGFSPQAPDELEKKCSKEKGYYGFFYISVKDFKDWFEKYKPYLKAGWASTWEAWAIKNKGYVPDYLSRYKDNEENVFVEYDDVYEPSRHIYNYFVNNKIDDDADLQVFFDW